jgi:hypothetical protein
MGRAALLIIGFENDFVGKDAPLRVAGAVFAFLQESTPFRHLRVMAAGPPSGEYSATKRVKSAQTF